MEDIPHRMVPIGAIAVVALFFLGILLVVAMPYVHGVAVRPELVANPVVAVGFASSSHAVSAPVFLNVTWTFSANPSTASYTVTSCRDFRNGPETLRGYGLPITTSRSYVNVTGPCLVAASPTLLSNNTPSSIPWDPSTQLYAAPVVRVMLQEAASPYGLHTVTATLPIGTTTGAPVPVLPRVPPRVLGPLVSPRVGWWVSGNGGAYPFSAFTWTRAPVGTSGLVLDVFQATCAQADVASAFGISPMGVVGLTPFQTSVNLTLFNATTGQYTGLFVPDIMLGYCAVLAGTLTNGTAAYSNWIDFATPEGLGASYASPVHNGQGILPDAFSENYVGLCQNTCVPAWGNASVTATGFSTPAASAFGTTWGWITVNVSYLKSGPAAAYDSILQRYPQTLVLTRGPACAPAVGAYQAQLVFSGTPSTLTIPLLRYPTNFYGNTGGAAWSFFIESNYSGNPRGYVSACTTVYTPLDPNATGPGAGGLFGQGSINVIWQGFVTTGTVALSFWWAWVPIAVVVGAAAGIAHSRRHGLTRG